MATCERCEEKGLEREGRPEPYGGPVLCADCSQSEAEEAYERFLSDYYGGSGPVTLQERYDAAAKQRRAERQGDHQALMDRVG